MAKPRIPSLSFKDFFCYDEATAFLTALAESRPGLCKLSSLGKSREGREVWCLAVTDFETGAPEDKPAYLVHGNIHAVELSGTHASLYTARQLLADHDKGPRTLREMAFYIVPRLNPDGAEFAATASGRIRSRYDRSPLVPNTLYQRDLDGDGLILEMRQEHPDGDLVANPKDRRLLVKRRADSKPPFYRVFPEGEIHEWDGSDRIHVEGRSFDWNRNWSYDWRPENEQAGAGDFPFSEPEMRAIGEFLHSHPNLFGVLGYHTGPNAVLRPPSTGTDDDLDEGDVIMMEDLARKGAEYTGFPVIPVYKYKSDRSRTINLRGHFHNFGYHHLGLMVFEFELGILLNSAGISTQQNLACDTDEERQELGRKLMAWWDQSGRAFPLFKPWRTFRHPQLGAVEIGGQVRKYFANPTLPDLKKISRNTYRFTLEHVSMRPLLALEDLEVTPVGHDVHRIRVRVANRGQLPTHVTNKGRSLKRFKGVRVELHPGEGVKLLSLHGHHEPGHLGAVTGSALLEWFVEAPAGSAGEIRAYGETAGNVTQTVTL